MAYPDADQRHGFQRPPAHLPAQPHRNPGRIGGYDDLRRFFGQKVPEPGATSYTPVLAVFVFEVVLNASALFNHANLRLPLRLDVWLRKFLVTPDMHRVHHSRVEQETNSNFGFCLSWWDWLFRSYRAQPEAGHDGMQIGLQEFGVVSESRLRQMLTQPFREKQ